MGPHRERRQTKTARRRQCGGAARRCAGRRCATRSICVPASSTVLIGPNGAGKTTLMRALAGLIAAEGRIELDGRAARPF